jgi:hypothetical protein
MTIGGEMLREAGSQRGKMALIVEIGYPLRK